MYYLTINAKRKGAKRHICVKSNSIDELKIYYGVLNPKYVVEIYNGKWELVERR